MNNQIFYKKITSHVLELPLQYCEESVHSQHNVQLCQRALPLVGHNTQHPQFEERDLIQLTVQWDSVHNHLAPRRNSMVVRYRRTQLLCLQWPKNSRTAPKRSKQGTICSTQNHASSKHTQDLSLIICQVFLNRIQLMYQD